jgi:predicted transcriptional regulator
MRTVTVKMTDQQFARLECIARERRIPKAQILREAFEQQGSAPRLMSAFDLVADLAGTVAGPADASTNKKYLDDLGVKRSKGRRLKRTRSQP